MNQSVQSCAGVSRGYKRAQGVLALFALAAIAGLVFGETTESAVKDMRAFYGDNCARCHGPDGSAVSAEGKSLRGENLTEPKWLKETSDETMVKAILKGKFFGWAMPAFKDRLSRHDAQRMVTDVIRKSKKGIPISAENPKPVEK